MNNTRIFYIESHQRGKTWICQVWERGQIFREWENPKISKRYQGNIFAAMRLVRELANLGYKGEIIAHLPDEIIANEANGTLDPTHSRLFERIEDAPPAWKGFKNTSIEELDELINYSCQPQYVYGKIVRLKRWIYLGKAYKWAKENGINLNIKLLSTKNIKLTNQAHALLLKPHNPPTHITAEKQENATK